MEAKWGGGFYPARVLKTERGWTWVEYESDRTREWVEPWRLRPIGSKADTNLPSQPNETWNKPNAPAPAGPPKPQP